VNAWLTVVSTFFLCYFIALDAVYALLFAISFYQSGVHMRRLALGGDDIVRQSPLTPPISIILPAFNEEACIVDSVDALRLLEYSELEIIVVDDGSTDATLERLSEAYDLVHSRTPLRLQLPSKPAHAVYVSRRLPNLVVICKENGGCKADAINAGVNAARYPLVCITDADAILEKDALVRAVRPFIERPRETIAVGGTVRIVNGCAVSVGRVTRIGAPRNLLAALQVVEYMRAFIASRTAWSRLGGLFLISGAFGVFRKDALVEVGGFNPKAIGEDMELVLRMQRVLRQKNRPFRIVFAPDPVCWTEAPETIKVLRAIVGGRNHAKRATEGIRVSPLFLRAERRGQRLDRVRDDWRADRDIGAGEIGNRQRLTQQA
jgi:cellulose synthase/poly-beta-1,6-N-acetylglucosamine synthase-like glycosyltransferase